MKNKIKYTVLVVYAYHRFPMRQTVWDHIYCFDRSPLCHCVYINLRYRNIGRLLNHINFDLVIFDTTFAGQRWSREKFKEMMKRAQSLKNIDIPKAIIPQDEFLNTDLLNQFIREYRIDHLFTVIPESEWPKVYNEINMKQTRLTRVLTGYLEPGTLNVIARISKRVKKSIDIGYRASGFYWFGTHGRKKIIIGEKVLEAAQKKRLITDIDVGQVTEADRIKGKNWYAFLQRCKYTLGTDSGTSVHDRDGSIRQCTEAYLKAHPDAGFLEVKQACFENMDKKASIIAISPRHLEACATETCQILMQGHYNGILKPGVHYIELKSDFSNLDEVLELVEKDDKRLEITERAYRDIVASGRYTYNRFVENILNTTLQQSEPVRQKSPLLFYLSVLCLKLMDRSSWFTVWFINTFFTPEH